MRIEIVGNGNVGTHLLKALNPYHEVKLIGAREMLASGYPNRSKSILDLILLTVTDASIEKVAEKLSQIYPDFHGVVVHTAGSLGIDILGRYFNRFGVVYPLQTFTKGVDINDYSQIPCFIEGSDAEVERYLRDAVAPVFTNVIPLSSDRRRALHIASVFACNFTNAMYSAASDILGQYNLPFSYVLPLIRQTVDKVEIISPREAQTGPARRGDINIIEAHLNAISDSKLHEIYKLLSDYISTKTCYS